MLSFESDYTKGAHVRILERLLAANGETMPGYGSDLYCEQAKEKIRTACACPEAEIYFLVGGTQTNAAVIGTMLPAYAGVIAAQSGHVNTHEAGAIECTGHKVLTCPSHNGKLDPGEVRAYAEQFYADQNREHMVYPGMVYISHPTEYGTLYTKSELEELSEICREYDMVLYADGARLGYGLEAKQTDVTLPVLAKLCDVFYIGGTKVGAMFGEAVVFTKRNAPRHFLTLVKQKGALLAKGWLLGLQFDTLFTDELYWKISRRAIETAALLKEVLRENELPFYLESPTNQQFVVLENEQMEALKPHVAFSFWEKLDEKYTVVRFATSWATTKEEIMELADLLKKIRG